jgi:hypothetical protein
MSTADHGHGYKALPKAAIAGALAKAERYRLLNEPEEAESICRDILAASPGLEEALVTFLLAVTDQFPRRTLRDAQEILEKLAAPYDRAYYRGIALERWAKAQIDQVPPNVTYHLITDALAAFEEAQGLGGAENPDAILRYNYCVRLLESRPELAPKASDEPGGEGYGWDEPPTPTRPR